MTLPAWPPPAPPPPPRKSGLTVGVVVVLIVVAVIALSATTAVGIFTVGRILDATTVSDVPAAEAGCRPDHREPARESDLNHVPVGTKVDYRTTPPAFGQHWPNFLQQSEIRSFYDVADRPPVERLVHSLEHGYTILWYDVSETDAARDIADELGPKFIAAPWTEADGPPLAEGAHAVLVHWSVSAAPGGQATTVALEEPTDAGVSRSCEHVSSEVADDFMTTYPYTDSHEPSAP